jgi:hypothetical protein
VKPFRQSRTWFRGASVGQRTSTLVGGFLAVALLAALVAPADVDGDGTAAAFTTGGGAAATEEGAEGAAQPGGAATQGSPDATAPTGSGAGAPSAAGSTATSAGGAGGSTDAAGASSGGQACPPGGDQGVTADTITVAVTIINIAGPVANEAIGVPTPEVQEAQWKLVADAINAAGGAGCHQLVIKPYRVNPIDPTDAQQKCLQIANAKPFAAIDTGSLTALGFADCIPAQKTPLLANGVTLAQIEKYAPYYLSSGDVEETVSTTGVFGLRDRGFFGEGFEKLGYVYRSCLPDLVKAERQALRDAGIPDDKVVVYDLGCNPSGQATPADWQAAVLRFRQAGVTHVFFGPVAADFASFTQFAQQQGYKPRYGLVADDLIATTGGAFNPDPENFDGALNIATSRYSENNTPGLQPTAGTARCDAIFTAKGQPPTWRQQVGYGGVVCNLLGMLDGLIDKAPKLEGEALLGTLPALGKQDLSFPSGPTDFSKASSRQPHGRSDWRPVRWLRSCTCWRVEDPTFRPPAR